MSDEEEFAEEGEQNEEEGEEGQPAADEDGEAEKGEDGGENEENEENEEKKDDEDDEKKEDGEDEEKKEDEEPEEEDDPVPPKPLTVEQAAFYQSMLAQDPATLSYGYTRINLPEKELTDISAIAAFKFLRYLDVPQNYLTSLAVIEELPNLTMLNANENRLRSIKLNSAPSLKCASFNGNKVKNVQDVHYPELHALALSSNPIKNVSTLTHVQFPKLRELELRNLDVGVLSAISLSNITTLYLAGNKLVSLHGASQFPHLKRLHVRGNEISSLEGLGDGSVPLEYLNLRQNLIDRFEEIALLIPVPTLRVLVLTENALADMNDYRVEIVSLLPQLVRLDKTPVSAEEQGEAAKRQNPDGPK